MSITLRLPYPISTNRYWRARVVNGIAMTYVSAEAKAFKQEAAILAKYAGIKLKAGPMQVSLMLHPKLTTSGEASRVQPDIDNCLKVMLDSLNGLAWVDDKQVRRLSAEYGAPVKDGGMSVTISDLVPA